MGPALQNTALPGPGGQGRPPLQNPIGKRCVGAGVSDGPNWAYTAFLAMCHCEGALRPWQSVPPSPTECLPMAVCRGRPPGRPVSGLVQILILSVGADASVRPPDLHRTSCKSNVIAKPVRTLAVAIRVLSLHHIFLSTVIKYVQDHKSKIQIDPLFHGYICRKASEDFLCHLFRLLKQE